MADKKTIQAQKVSASWTPSDSAARQLEAGIDLHPVGVRIIGGRLRFAAALVADYGDADLMGKNADWFKKLRIELENTGTVHTFDITAGAAPIGDVLDPFGILADPTADAGQKGEAA